MILIVKYDNDKVCFEESIRTNLIVGDIVEISKNQHSHERAMGDITARVVSRIYDARLDVLTINAYTKQ